MKIFKQLGVWMVFLLVAAFAYAQMFGLYKVISYDGSSFSDATDTDTIVWIAIGSE